ncbi:GyrI-like domain-containing protein [Paenisporosarcina antarctica]|uniref:AraC family transcriptional regulator n=1 Tax=Paenisporosarcina antarctica TaxID=417367 RepID=A0A4P7A0A7_9BACL|nr:GyrI-like domain-containing protein [Paenisporosarcina antarctica]QBP42420.1 AraC family transcriptional regulator [Paenisporosarcina antarctica]
MQVRIKEKPEFRIIGVKRTFSCDNGENKIEIPKMWDEVHQNGINDELVELNSGEVKGLLGVCRGMDSAENTMEYWIATAYNGEENPHRYERLDIPAATYAVFAIVGPMPQAMQSMWEKIYSEWFPASAFRPSGSPELEVYTNDDASKEDYRSEIWIPVVEKKMVHIPVTIH